MNDNNKINESNNRIENDEYNKYNDISKVFMKAGVLIGIVFPIVIFIFILLFGILTGDIKKDESATGWILMFWTFSDSLKCLGIGAILYLIGTYYRKKAKKFINSDNNDNR